LGQVLLLRRDRYVAAVATPDKTDTLLSTLKNMRAARDKQTDKVEKNHA
jgi:hypothetical protein